VIECVETFEPEFEQSCIAEAHTLSKSQVEVLNTRAVEHAPLRVSQLPQKSFLEAMRIEGGLAVASVDVDMERPGVYRGVSSR
jgi:hypothetical protein